MNIRVYVGDYHTCDQVFQRSVDIHNNMQLQLFLRTVNIVREQMLHIHASLNFSSNPKVSNSHCSTVCDYNLLGKFRDRIGKHA